MLREATLNEIREALTVNSFFSLYDYDIKQTGQNGNVTLVINYKYLDNCEVVAYFKGEDIAFNVKPGKVMVQEFSRLKSIYELKDEIVNWLGRIQEEFKTRPVERTISEHEKRINEIEKFIEEVPDQYFTKAEAEELKMKLAKLEEEFAEKLKKEIQDQNQLKQEISSLHNEIHALKQQTDLFTKKNWLKSLTGKTIKWVSNNPKMVKSALGITKNFLPLQAQETVQDIMNIIPSENSDSH